MVSVPETYLGPVLSDLTAQRRAQVREVATTVDTRVIHAVVPIASLVVSRFTVSVCMVYCVSVGAYTFLNVTWIHVCMK